MQGGFHGNPSNVDGKLCETGICKMLFLNSTDTIRVETKSVATKIAYRVTYGDGVRLSSRSLCAVDQPRQHQPNLTAGYCEK